MLKYTFEQGDGSGAMEGDFYEQVEKSHGRIETRRCLSVTDSECIDYLNDKDERRGLSAVVMIECERVSEGVVSRQRRYYICSLLSLIHI